MYKPTTPCLEKPRRFKQVDLHFVSPIFFVCYSHIITVQNKVTTCVCVCLCLFTVNLSHFYYNNIIRHVREAISCYFRVPRWLILCCQ